MVIIRCLELAYGLTFLKYCLAVRLVSVAILEETAMLLLSWLQLLILIYGPFYAHVHSK
jgi:hypothetical protein